MTYKEIQCYIEDVQFHDYWDDAAGIPYNNIIIIVLRNAETSEIYSGAWTEADIRKIANISEKLGSRQMIDFATLLRQRSGLLLLTVPDNDEKIIITPALLMQSEETERKVEDNISKFQGNEHLSKRRNNK